MMKRALIIDVSAILYRSFYKMRSMSSSDGFPTGALYGFTISILNLLDKFNTDFVVAALDISRERLKRRDIYPEYKMNRDAAPEDLVRQIGRVRDILDALSISYISKDGYEADDVIASLVDRFYSEGIESYVVTGDKDLMQLVPRAKIVIGDTTISSPDEVRAKLGVDPDRVVDLFALQGDSSDGIPGVPGIGPKGAVKLIDKFGSLDEIYESLDQLPDKLRVKLEDSRELAYISRELATLTLFPIEGDFTRREFSEELVDILDELEFRSIIKRLNLRDRDSKSVDVEEIDRIVLDKRSVILFEDDRFYIYDGNRVLVSSEIDFNGHIVDTYNAKELYKRESFNLGLDLMIGYHLLFPEERVTLDRAIMRALNEDSEGRVELRAYYLERLFSTISEKMVEANLVEVYESIERPLISVLSYMESVGSAIDVKYIERYSSEIESRISILSSKIVDEAGEEFNISSPKQLSHILFDKMNLPKIKKTKSGYSTDAEVLDQLKGFKIVRYILEYRRLTKIYSTYLLTLPKLSIDGRVHTTYHQDGTSTGRLSSSNPNLQNIPAHGEGLKVRKAFISGRDRLAVFDYSQIELRILASISKDQNLIDAYRSGLDLHMLTAQKIFGRSEITKDERDRAKVINFSLIYGKSAFGLAKELGVSISEAKEYIERYFKEYPMVKSFIERTVEEARRDGYVKTLYGRKRYLKDINSSNKIVRSASERAAVNAVIQGTQADIIKVAMIDIMKIIKDRGVDMTMQVHDELVFEVDSNELNIVDKILEIMKRSPLDIPIDVHLSVVDSWDEAK